VCDAETSRMRRPWLALGHRATGGGRESRRASSRSAIWRKIVQQLRPLILHIKKKIGKIIIPELISIFVIYIKLLFL